MVYTFNNVSGINKVFNLEFFFSINFFIVINEVLKFYIMYFCFMFLDEKVIKI